MYMRTPILLFKGRTLGFPSETEPRYFFEAKQTMEGCIPTLAHTHTLPPGSTQCTHQPATSFTPLLFYGHRSVLPFPEVIYMVRSGVVYRN